MKPDNRKRIIFYGNCHIMAVRMALEQYKPFVDSYKVIPVKPIQDIKDETYFNGICFLECDVFVHQSIRENNRYGEAYSSARMIDRLRKDCKIISIPNVYHMPLCFFPQYIEKNAWQRKDGSTVFFRDRILDEAYRKGLSIEETVNVYNDPKTYCSSDLITSFYLFMDKVKEREKEWDIKVSRYIENNYMTTRLFYDPNHPTPDFLMYIVRNILELLEIEIIEDIEKIKPIELYAYEMPLTKSVLDTFDMSFPIRNIRWNSKNVMFSNLSLSEYIKCYWMFEWQDADLKTSLRLKSRIMYAAFSLISAPKILMFVFKKVFSKIFYYLCEIIRRGDTCLEKN